VHPEKFLRIGPAPVVAFDFPLVIYDDLNLRRRRYVQQILIPKITRRKQQKQRHEVADETHYSTRREST